MSKVSPRLAVFLAHRQADWEDPENKPQEDKIARAAIDTAAEAVHIALGIGMTGTSIAMTVMDWVRANPRPCGNFKRGAQVGFPFELKAWVAKAEAELPALIESTT